MKTNPCVRPATILAALSFILAAQPSEAWWIFGCRDAGCIARDKVKDRAGQEFDNLQDQIKEQYKESPNKGLYLSQIRETQKRFDSQADQVLKKEKYAEWEFKYIGERVTEVIIPSIKTAVEATQASPEQAVTAAFAKAAVDGDQRGASHFKRFVNQNRKEIESSAVQVSGEAAPNGDTATEESPSAAVSGLVGAHTSAQDSTDRTLENQEGGHLARLGTLGAATGGQGLSQNGRPTAEVIVSNSDVVKLAEVSAEFVKANNNSGETPGGGTGTPGGGTGTPGGGTGTPGGGTGTPGGGTGTPGGGTGTPGGGTGSPGSGGSSRPPRWPGSGLIRAIASPAGVSQLYATNSMQSLQSRNFGEAFRLSQRALAIDPSNRNALEVYHATKGRLDAVSSVATSIGVAKDGASALGGGLNDAGSFGGAASSPGIAALATSGAARVANEQARSEATVALKLGDAEGAIAILGKALAENPDNPELLNLRAQVYGRLGRWEDALKDASSGLKLVPGNLVLLNTMALAQNRTRRWRDALATSEAMIAVDRRNAWAFANRAHAHAGLGNRDAMLSDINHAASLDPNFRRSAAAAAELQLPSDADVLFLFPGEVQKKIAPAPTAAGRGRTFSVIIGAGIGGGLLVALGLLSLVMKPVKDSVVSVFTRTKQPGAGLAPVATAQPVSAAGNLGGLIRGQYEIARQIGAGGMGMVYEGTDRSLGRRVAIKKMREELRQNPRERDRFIIEAKTVASLHHPSIVDIYAIAEEGDDVYLVFEYVDGKTVHDLVQTRGRIDPSETVRVTRAMGDALTYAHAHGVIHRDMKPSNVMLTAAGQVKVMDFGIARMAKDAMTRYSMTNTVVGTPPYMAPEQEQGVVRKESDVYSLAICAYEMLTGKLPFIGMGAGMLMNKINMSYIPPSRAIAGLPEALDEVFLKAFQADPERRHRTPQEFTAALAAAADGARSKLA